MAQFSVNQIFCQAINGAATRDTGLEGRGSRNEEKEKEKTKNPHVKMALGKKGHWSEKKNKKLSPF